MCAIYHIYAGRHLHLQYPLQSDILTLQPASMASYTNFCPASSLSGTTITCLPKLFSNAVCCSLISLPSKTTPSIAIASIGTFYSHHIFSVICLFIYVGKTYPHYVARTSILPYSPQLFLLCILLLSLCNKKE